MINCRAIKSKIDRGIFTVVQRNSRSEVYNVFYDIKDSNGIVLKNAMQCTWCKKVYTATKTTSNLCKHSCFKKYKILKKQQRVKEEPTPEVKTKCMEFVVRWIVGNCRPYNVASDEGFYKLVEFLLTSGHKFGAGISIDNLIPHSTTLTRNIASQYEDQRETLKREMNDIKEIGFTISCDLWSDNSSHTSYVGVTVHYMKSGFIANQFLGIREVSSVKSSGSNIRNVVAKILRDYNCELNKMVTVITDGGSTMMETFQHDRRITCIKHLLNRVIEEAVSDTSEVNLIKTTCLSLIKYSMKSGVNSVLNIAPPSYAATRRDTMFYLLQSVQQNWDDINQILQEKNMTSRLSNLDIHDINEILGVLKPFEEASCLLADENIPTIHHVYPHVRKLKTICSKSHPSESEMIKKFKKKLLLLMEAVIDPNIQDLHKIALFLFPPANKLYNFAQNEKTQIHEKCKEMLMAYGDYSTNSSITMEFMDIDTDVFCDFVQSSVTPDVGDDLTSEIVRYECQSVLYFKQFDPLEWWETHKREYPLLYKLSSFVLTTPASCAASVRFCSKVRHLLSESALDREPFRVNQVMFMHSNLNVNNLPVSKDNEVEPTVHNSDSESENSKCSTTNVVIKKCLSPIPD